MLKPLSFHRRWVEIKSLKIKVVWEVVAILVVAVRRRTSRFTVSGFSSLKDEVVPVISPHSKSEIDSQNPITQSSQRSMKYYKGFTLRETLCVLRALCVMDLEKRYT